MILRPLYGKLLVTRDPDEHEYRSKDGLVTIIYPGVEQKRAQTGYVHYHEYTVEWMYGERFPLDNKRILFSKYSEQEFKIDGRTFCIVDERDVLAVFRRRDSMKKETFLETINKKLGEVEGDDLSGQDLTTLAEDINEMAETEYGVEDGDEDVEEESEGDDIPGTGEDK